MEASIFKDALQYTVDSSRPLLVEKDGVKFAVFYDGTVKELVSSQREPRPDTLPLSSLDALCMMVRSEAVETLISDGGIPGGMLYITVPEATKAVAFTNPGYDDMFRQVFYEAEAADVPGWEPDAQFSFEEAQIALRTRFQHTDDSEYCLNLLSQITTGAKVTYTDNGVATSVVTQKGAAFQENQVIRPIVKLRPYRTFMEVEQPLGEFLIRISERGIRFIEADGGMWRLTARQTVKQYLMEQLRDLIDGGRVLIAL